MYHFLMPYARNRPFVMQPPRSLFLDGEIALMLASRRLVAEKEAYRGAASPARRGRSCGGWRPGRSCAPRATPTSAGCSATRAALAAVRISDRLDGSDHRSFFAGWVQTAKEKLVDPGRGCWSPVSRWTAGRKDGPEGSSIWMTAHCLQLIDEEFAADQYRRARKELGRVVLGFGYAREWPVSWVGPEDVDSGPVVPVLGVSAGSSGLAFLARGPSTTGRTSAGFRHRWTSPPSPVSEQGRLRYCAGNQVGDAVLLYAAVLGPLWDEVRKRPAEAPKP